MNKSILTSIVFAGTFIVSASVAKSANAAPSGPGQQEYRVTCTGASDGNWILDVNGLHEALEVAGECFENGGSPSISPIYRW